MNTIDITPIVNAALALIGAGVSVFLIPWLKKQTTEAQRKELTAWVIHHLRQWLRVCRRRRDRTKRQRQGHPHRGLLLPPLPAERARIQ